MRAVFLLVLRALCVALLLPVAAGADVSHHHENGSARCETHAETGPAHDGAGGSDADPACDDARDSGHAGLHCPVMGCAALVAEVVSLPAALPALRAAFSASRGTTRLLARAEGPDRPPDA